jgi:hypothetical protein
MAVLMAATHPERVSALVLYGSYARRTRAPGYPWAQTEEERRRYNRPVDRTRGTGKPTYGCAAPRVIAPMQRWWAQRMRASATPSTIRALMDMNSLVDVRDVLSAVRVPTLVLAPHRRRTVPPRRGSLPRRAHSVGDTAASRWRGSLCVPQPGPAPRRDRCIPVGGAAARRSGARADRSGRGRGSGRAASAHRAGCRRWPASHDTIRPAGRSLRRSGHRRPLGASEAGPAHAGGRDHCRATPHRRAGGWARSCD